jgi:hypothetical protein
MKDVDARDKRGHDRGVSSEYAGNVPPVRTKVTEE